jgi:antitoxin component YwqK of YwqJK toxin-antitoxin module
MKNHLFVLFLFLSSFTFCQNYGKLFKTINSNEFEKASLLILEISSDKQVDSSIISLANSLIYSNKQNVNFNPLLAYSAFNSILESSSSTYSSKLNDITVKFKINLNDLKSLIESEIYEQVSNSDNIEKLQQIILICNQCNYLENARNQVERLEFDNVKKNKTIEEYNAFLEKYPYSSHAKEIIEIRDSIAFNYAKNNLKDLNAFILKYPESKFKNNALKTKEKFINNAETIEYFENGNIYSIGIFKNDLEEGNWTYYNEDGSKNHNCNYKSGLLHGEYKIFDEYGIISSIRHFENGEELFKNGDSITYYSNGQIKSKCYYKNGKLEGPRIEYNYQGVVIEEENYFNGKLNGLSISRYGNGEVSRTQNYSNGLRNGEGTHNTNGCLEIENYLNDTLNGDYIKKDRSGKIICSGKYNNGEMVGYWTWCEEGGRLLWEGNRTDGVVKHYDYHGKVHKIENYKNGKLNGSYKSIYNGITVAEGLLENGYAVGQWKMKYSNGKPQFKGYCSENGKYVDLYKFERLNKTEFDFISFPFLIFFSEYCEFLYENGNTFFKGNFTNGEVNYYLMDGNIYMNEKYNNGKLISRTEYYNSKFNQQIQTINLEYDGDFVSRIKIFVNNIDINEIFDKINISPDNYCDPEYFDVNKENRKSIQYTVYNSDTIVFNGYSKCHNEKPATVSSQDIDNFKTGEICFFTHDFRKFSEGELLNGEKIGVWKIYHKEILEAHYSSDEIKTYYPNGSIYSIEKCKNYKLHGDSIFYYKNGNIKFIAHYVNGKKDCQIIE